MKRLVYLFITLVFLSGCVTSGTKIDQNKVTQIKEGITTEQNVIQLLGNPYTKTLTSDGRTIMLYHYVKVKNRASNFIPVANLLVGGMDMQQQMLTVLIGQDGKVEKYTLNDSATPINSGMINTN